MSAQLTVKRTLPDGTIAKRTKTIDVDKGAFTLEQVNRLIEEALCMARFEWEIEHERIIQSLRKQLEKPIITADISYIS